MTRSRRLRLLLAGALAGVAVHLAFWRGYGWFRDEFYYFACAAHLDYGYVDHPALSIVPVWAIHHTIGDSLFAIRFVAAIVSGAVILVTGLMARSLGAGWFGQTLAMLCALVAPVYLALGSFYSMNVFDLLVWALAGWIVIELLKAPRMSLWIALGILLGLGFENKISVLWLCGGLALGLILTPQRRLLLTPGPWVAALIAAALFAPYIVWQMRHHWYTLEFIQRASADKMASHSLASFTISQITDMLPFTAPVWISGLYFYLWSPGGRLLRALGILYLSVFALLAIDTTSRSGYLAASYAMLLAAGGVQVESMLSRGARVPVLAFLAITGTLIAPQGMPILPEPTYLRYSAALGGKPNTEERKAVGLLSQFYADREGWDDIVGGIARVYHSLLPDERRIAGIFVSNYGEAGAVDVLGPAYGLPRATSGHNNYWLWGPGPYSGQVMIIFSPTTKERLQSRFANVEEAFTIDCGLCMPYENHRPVFICRGPKQSWVRSWPALKHFD
jgi:4-amino-4-deoxy-L-arabinose transferase-like glycosyltransferase